MTWLVFFCPFALQNTGDINIEINFSGPGFRLGKLAL